MSADEAGVHRDFLGRGFLINLLRALHLVGVVGVGASLLSVRPASETASYAGILMLAGLLIVALDRWSNPAYFSQVNGLAVLFKLSLLAAIWMMVGLNAVLFWGVLVGSVLISHAPRTLRHRKLL